jgi:actin-related protein
VEVKLRLNIDEVSSLVFDLGSFNCRVGYSGEDSPKSVFQPYVGINKFGDNQSYYFSDVQLRYYKEGTKVYNVIGNNGASILYLY